MSKQQKKTLAILKSIRSIGREALAKKVTKGDVGALVLHLRGLQNRGFRKEVKKVAA